MRALPLGRRLFVERVWEQVDGSFSTKRAPPDLAKLWTPHFDKPKYATFNVVTIGEDTGAQGPHDTEIEVFEGDVVFIDTEAGHQFLREDNRTLAIFSYDDVAAKVTSRR